MAAGDLITADMQIEWRSTLLGHGTPYGWKNLAGWIDLPSARVQDQPRPFRHGSYAGQLLSDERVITYDFQISAGPWPAAIDTLRTITAMEEAPDEEPLVIQLSGAKWQVNARCTKRALPVDVYYTAQASSGAIQWVATDPRLYSPGAVNSVSCGLPQPSSGLVFPLVFPLVFGSGAGGNSVSALNTGTITSWPTFLVTGPVTGPIITNVGTGDVLRFDPAFVVPAGQTMTINTDAHSASLVGINRRNSLLTANWFGLKANVATQIQFTSVGVYDPAAQLTVQWRHATI